MRTLLIRSLAAAAFAGASALAGAAPAEGALPATQHYGSVEYLTGGIGHDESSAIQHVRAQWPATLEFAVKDGPNADYVADVQVRVRNAKGNVVLSADAAGPFLLARLAPGHYTVDAQLDGKRVTQSLDVKSASAQRIVLLWPAGTDEAQKT